MKLKKQVATVALLTIISINCCSGWISARVAHRQSSRLALATRIYQSNPNTDNDDANNSDDTTIAFNELHTLLRDAVERQDFDEAGRISNRISARLFPGLPPDQRRRNLSWKAAPWLTDRLVTLNYTFPTTIQITSMLAVDAILKGDSNYNNHDDDAVIQQDTQQQDNDETLEERVRRNGKDMGIVVSGTTGSGKTLAYLVPLLSTLTDSLFKRQRIRGGGDDALRDPTAEWLDRVVVTVPNSTSARNSKQQQQLQSEPVTTHVQTLGDSGTNVIRPLALIVVPSRELGLQTASLLYRLVGGGTTNKNTPRRANTYKGPKGVKIACVLNEEEATYGLTLQTDIAITTPEYLGKLLNDGHVDPLQLRVIVFDEADLGLELTPSQDLAKLFNDDDDDDERDYRYSRLTFLVGASVTESLGNLAVSSRLLPETKSYIATSAGFAPLAAASTTKRAAEFASDEPKTASLKDLDVCLYPGLKHERAVVAKDCDGLLILTRLIRTELKLYDQALAKGENVQRPRVVVFFPDETQARAAIEPLRDSLWGRHLLCVLLPKTGVRPIEIMEQFKNNETSVMLATANSVRGLDFPALTHVYTMYLPKDDPREYVHLAGRVARVGQEGCVTGNGGHVISILQELEAHNMDELARTLGFEFTDIDVDSLIEVRRNPDGLIDPETDVEVLRRYLEDAILFGKEVVDKE
jgi:superfamily II DNA/RNA helicase